jgi:hypothetical protein
MTKWVCQEDPDCPAQHHFSQSGKVNGYHVKMLDDCFVPSINGLWNGLGTEELPPKAEEEMLDPERGLFRRVVPSYSHRVQDRIPKKPEKVENGEFNQAVLCNNPLTSDDVIEIMDDDPDCNNGLLNSFNNLNANNLSGSDGSKEFKEWYELMNVKSYNDDVLTILPYVVID